MKRDFFRYLFPRVEQFQSIQQLREQLLNFLLVTSILISTGWYFLALIPAIQEGMLRNMPVYTFLYVILLLITILRHAPYRLRVGILLGLIYILGVINLFHYGLNIDAGLFFLILVVMTFLFISLWYGVLVFIGSGLTIAIMGFYIVRGGTEIPIPLSQTNPVLWVVSGSVFLLAGVVLILSLNVLVSGLENQLSLMRTLFADIEEAKTDLEEKGRRFNALLRGSTDMIALLDKDGTIRYASPSIERMLGYAVDEILGQKVYDYLHPESVTSATLAMTPGVPAEQIGPFLELQIRHRDGTWRVLEVAGTDIYGDPAVNGTVINCRDITDWKQIEAKLRATQAELEKLVVKQQHEIDTYGERLAQLVQYSPVIIYGYGHSEPFEPPFISENIFQLTGYEASEFMKDIHLWLSLVHPEDRDQASQNFRLELEERGLTTREYRFLHKDGRYRWFHEEARQILDEAHSSLEFVGCAVDITQQKQSEAAYVSLVESSMQGVLLSQDGRVVFANRSLCDSLGLSMQEVTGLTAEQAMEHLHPGDINSYSSIRELLRNLSEEGLAPAQFEVRWMRAEGEIRWLEVNVNQMDFRGRPAYQVIVLDITERKHAELNLVESEKINRLLLETTLDSVLLVNSDGIVQACNMISAQRLGFDIETLKGKCIYDLIDPDVAIFRKDKIDLVFCSGIPISFEDQRDGHWYLHNLYPIFDGRQNISQIAIFATDITHRKEMEEELRNQKDILEAEVASRTRELRDLSQELIRAQEVERQKVSRELHDEAGQLLVGLGLSLDAVLDEIPKEQRAVRKLIKNTRDSVSRVTKNIRSLARSLRPPALDIAGLNTVLKDLCIEVSDFASLDVSYQGQEIDLPEVVSISLYRFVQEALTNVVKHAKASRVDVRLSAQDGQVCLAVSDNGKGMNPGKHVGGLGLLGFQERAALLGGKVDIESSQSGTSVKINVPLMVNGKLGREEKIKL